MASPHPKATAENERRGNPGKRKKNQKEPKFQESSYKPPKELRDKVAIDEWNSMSTLLSASGVMTVADERALLLYCNSFSTYIQAICQIDKLGFVLLTHNGSPVQNPWAAEKHKSHSEMEKMLLQFGMTPSSRTRIEATDTGPKKSGVDRIIEENAD